MSYCESSCIEIGEVVENLVRVLRDAGRGGLQQHVDDRVVVAAQLVAEELIFARRTAGDQQHAILAIDDFDVGSCASWSELSAAISRWFGSLTRICNVRRPGSLMPGNSNFTRSLWPSVGSVTALLAFDVPRFGRQPCFRPGREANSTDRCRPASPWASMIGRDRETIAGIDSHRHGEFGDVEHWSAGDRSPGRSGRWECRPLEPLRWRPADRGRRSARRRSTPRFPKSAANAGR